MADWPSGITEVYSKVAVQTLIASDAITATDGFPYRLITSAGNITLSSQPTLAAGRDGQAIFLKNVGVNTITLQDVNALGGSNLRMTANTLTINAGGTMKLIYDATIGFWIEQYLLNPQSFTPSISGFTVDGSGAPIYEWGDGSTANDPAPVFAITYIGSPSAATATLTASPDAGYPLTITTPFTSGTGAVYFRSSTRNGTRTFRVTATVSGTAGLTKDVVVTYRAPNYAGIGTQTTGLTSAQVVALTHVLDTDQYDSYAVNATAGNYVWLAFVDAVAPFFGIGGEAAQFDLKDNPVSVTSTYLKVANYYTYRSSIISLGSITVVTQSSAFPTRRYWGKLNQSTQLTEAQIKALAQSDLTASSNGTFTNITLLGASDYIWLTLPSVISAPAHYGLAQGSSPAAYEEAGFTAMTVQSVTNQYGFVDASVKNIHSNVAALQAVTINAATSSTWSLKTQAAAFNRRIFMGPHADAAITSPHILTLDDASSGSSVLASVVAGTYAVTISGSNYLWFCHPSTVSDLTTIKDHSTGFAIAGASGGSFDTTGYLTANVSHTTDTGETITMRCWRSANVNIFPTGGTVDVT